MVPGFPGGERELVGGGAPIFNANGNPQGRTRLGGAMESLSLDNTGGGWPPTPQLHRITTEHSIVVLAEIDQIDPYGVLLCAPYDTYNPGWTAPYASTFLRRDTSTSSGSFAVTVGGTYYETTSDTGFLTAGEGLTLYGVTRSGTAVTFYRNGSQHGAAKTAGAAGAVDWGSQLNLGVFSRGNITAEGVDGRTVFALVFNRALTAGEMRHLAVDPLGMFRQRTTRTRVATLQETAIGGTLVSRLRVVDSTSTRVVSGAGDRVVYGQSVAPDSEWEPLGLGHTALRRMNPVLAGNRNKPDPWPLQQARVDARWRYLWPNIVYAVPLWERGGRAILDYATQRLPSGYSNTLTTSWQSDKAGPALRFSGTDTTIKWDTHPRWVLTGNASMVMVLQPDAVADYKLLIVEGGFSPDDTEANNAVWWISLNSSGQCSAFHEYGSGTNLTTTSTAFSYAAGERFVLAVTRDTAAQQYHFYKNGRLVESVAYATNPTAAGATGAYLTLTDRAEETNGPYAGVISATYLLNRRLSDAEVAALSADPYGPFRPATVRVAGSTASVATKTLAVGAHLVEDTTGTQAVAMEAALLATPTKSATADAVLLTSLPNAVVVEAMTVGSLSEVIGVEAALQKSQESAVTIEAALLQSLTGTTLAAEANLAAPATRTMTFESMLVASAAVEVGADAVLTEGSYDSLVMNPRSARLRRHPMGTLTAARKPLAWPARAMTTDPTYRSLWRGCVVAAPLWEAMGATGTAAANLATSLSARQGTIATPANVPVVAGWSGPARRWTAGGTTRITFGNSADLVPTSGGCTVVIRFRKRDATLRNSAVWGLASSPALNQRFGCSLPWSNNLVYWVYGGATEGATQLTATYTHTGREELWAFTTGPRGMEIWRDGGKVASNTANPSRTAHSGNAVALGGDATNNADNFDISLFLLWQRQLTAGEIMLLARDPYGMFRQALVAPAWGGLKGGAFQANAYLAQRSDKAIMLESALSSGTTTVLTGPTVNTVTRVNPYPIKPSTKGCWHPYQGEGQWVVNGGTLNGDLTTDSRLLLGANATDTTGDPAWFTAYPGLTLDGSSYATAQLAGATVLTVSFAVKFTAFPGTTTWFAGFSNAASTVYDKSIGVTSTGQLSWYIWDGGSKTANTTALQLNQWYWVECVADGSAISVYVNGVLVVTGAAGASSTGTTQFNVGRRRPADTPATGMVLGTILYDDAALTDAERAANYAVAQTIYPIFPRQSVGATAHLAGVHPKSVLAQGYLEADTGTGRERTFAIQGVIETNVGLPIIGAMHHRRIGGQGNRLPQVERSTIRGAERASQEWRWAWQSLAACVTPFGSNAPRDLVTQLGASATPVGAGWTVIANRAGRVPYNAGGRPGLTIPGTRGRVPMRGPFTVLAVVDDINTTDSGTRAIIGTVDQHDGIGGGGWTVLLRNSTGFVSFIKQSVGTYISSLTAVNGRNVIAVRVNADNSFSFFVNGVKQDGSNSSNFITTTTRNLTIGATSSTTANTQSSYFHLRGSFLIGYIWNTALPDDALYRLSTDPFGPVRFVQRSAVHAPSYPAVQVAAHLYRTGTPGVQAAGTLVDRPTYVLATSVLQRVGEARNVAMAARLERSTRDTGAWRLKQRPMVGGTALSVKPRLRTIDLKRLAPEVKPLWSGLRHLYLLNEASGSFVTDLVSQRVGSVDGATSWNTTTFTDRPFVAMDGGADRLTVWADDFAGPVTLAFRFRHRGSSVQQYTLFAGPQFTLAANTSNILFTSLRSTGSPATMVWFRTRPLEQVWQTWVLTYDARTTTAPMLYTQDGKQALSLSGSTAGKGAQLSGPGWAFLGNTSTFNGDFTGDIEFFYAWNRQLTAAEAMQVVQAPYSLFRTAGHRRIATVDVPTYGRSVSTSLQAVISPRTRVAHADATVGEDATGYYVQGRAPRPRAVVAGLRKMEVGRLATSALQAAPVYRSLWTGLLWAASPAAGASLDIHGRSHTLQNTTGTATLQARTRFGSAVALGNGSGDRISWPAPAGHYAGRLTRNFTLTFQASGAYDDMFYDYWPYLFSFSFWNSGSAAPWGIQARSYGTGIELYIPNAAGTSQYEVYAEGSPDNDADFFLPRDTGLYTYTIVREGSTVRLYRNGRLIVEVPGGYSGVLPSGTAWVNSSLVDEDLPPISPSATGAQVVLGGYPTGGWGIYGTVSMGAFWNRALTHGEVAFLGNQPHAMLQPTVSRGFEGYNSTKRNVGVNVSGSLLRRPEVILDGVVAGRGEQVVATAVLNSGQVTKVTAATATLLRPDVTTTVTMAGTLEPAILNVSMETALQQTATATVGATAHLQATWTKQIGMAAHFKWTQTVSTSVHGALRKVVTVTTLGSGELKGPPTMVLRRPRFRVPGGVPQRVVGTLRQTAMLPEWRWAARKLAFAAPLGGTARRDIVNGAVGTLMGAATWSRVLRTGPTLALTGASTDGVAFARSGALAAIGQDCTILAWANITAMESSATIAAIAYRDTETYLEPFDTISFGRYGATSSGYFGYATAAGTRVWVSSDSNFINTTSGFVLYGVVREGATVRFYRNGRQFGGPKTLTTNEAPAVTTAPLTIGNRSTSAPGGAIGGEIGTVYLWNRSLAPSEVRALAIDPFGPYRTSPRAMPIYRAEVLDYGLSRAVAMQAALLRGGLTTTSTFQSVLRAAVPVAITAGAVTIATTPVTETWTATGQVAEVGSETVTAGAQLYALRAGTVTVAGALQRLGVLAAVTAAARLYRTYTPGAQATAVLQATRQRLQPIVDALLEQARSRTVGMTAVRFRPDNPVSVSVAARLMTMGTQSVVQAAVLVKHRLTRTAQATGVVFKSGATRLAQVAAAISPPPLFHASAVLQRVLEAGVVASALLRARRTTSTTTNAVLQRGRVFLQSQMEALLEKARSKTVAMAGALQRVDLARSLSLAARLTTTSTLSVVATGMIRARQTLVASASAVRFRSAVPRTLLTSAVLSPPPVVQAIGTLLRAVEQSAGMLAVLRRTGTAGVASAATLARGRVTLRADVAALLEKARSKTVMMAAALQWADITKALQAAAWLTIRDTREITVAAIVRQRILGAVAVTAVLRRAGTRLVQAGAALSPPPLLVATAVLQRTVEQGVTLAAMLRARMTAAVTTGAVLERRRLFLQTFMGGLLEKGRSKTVGMTTVAHRSEVTLGMTVAARLTTAVALAIGAGAVIRRRVTATATATAVLFRSGAMRTVQLAAELAPPPVLRATATLLRTLDAGLATGAVLSARRTAGVAQGAVLRRGRLFLQAQASALLEKARSKTIGVAGVAQRTGMARSFSLASHLTVTSTMAVAATAVLFRRATAVLLATAVRFKAGATSATTMAALLSPPPLVQAGAVLQRTAAQTVAVAAVLRQRLTSAVTMTAVLQRGRLFLQVVGGGLLEKARSKTVAASTVTTRPGLVRTLAAAARLTSQSILTLEAAGTLLRRGATSTMQVAASLQGFGLSRVVTVAAQLAPPPVLVATAVLQRTVEAAMGTAAVLRMTIGQAMTGGAVLERRRLFLQVPMAALLEKGRSRTVGMTAVAARVGLVAQVTAAARLTSRTTLALTTAATLVRRQVGSAVQVTVSILGLDRSRTVTMAATLAPPPVLYVTAVLQRVVERGVGVAATIRARLGQAVTAVAVLRRGRLTLRTEITALLEKARSRTVGMTAVSSRAGIVHTATVAAYLASRQTLALGLDAVVRLRRTATVAVTAALHRTGLIRTVAASADLSPPMLFRAGAVLQRALEVTLETGAVVRQRLGLPIGAAAVLRRGRLLSQVTLGALLEKARSRTVGVTAVMFGAASRAVTTAGHLILRGVPVLQATAVLFRSGASRTVQVAGALLATRGRFFGARASLTRSAIERAVEIAARLTTRGTLEAQASGRLSVPGSAAIVTDAVLQRLRTATIQVSATLQRFEVLSAVAAGAYLFRRTTLGVTSGAVLRRGRLFLQVHASALLERARSRTVGAAAALQVADRTVSTSVMARLITTGATTMAVTAVVWQRRVTRAAQATAVVLRQSAARVITASAEIAPPPVVWLTAVLVATREAGLATSAQLFARVTRSLTASAVLQRGRVFQQVVLQALAEKARHKTLSITGSAQRSGLARSLTLAARLTVTQALSVTAQAVIARLRRSEAVGMTAASSRAGMTRLVTLAAQLAPPPVVQVLATLVGTVDQTVAAGARLVATVSTGVTAGAVLRHLRLTLRTTADALLEKARSRTVATTAVLRLMDQTTATSLAARLVQQATTALTVGAVLARLRQLGAVSVAAAVQRVGRTRAVTLAAHLAPPPIIQVAAVLAATATQAMSAGARLIATVARDITAGAVLQRSRLRPLVTVGALLEKARSRTVGVAAVVFGTSTRQVGVGATLILRGTAAVQAAASLFRSGATRAVVLAGALRRTPARLFSTRAVLRREGVGQTVQASARVTTRGTSEVQAAATVATRGTPQVQAVAVLLRVRTTVVQASAVLFRSGATMAAVIGGYLFRRTGLGVALTAVLQRSRLTLRTEATALLEKARSRTVAMTAALRAADRLQTTTVAARIITTGTTTLSAAGTILRRRATRTVQATAVIVREAALRAVTVAAEIAPPPVVWVAAVLVSTRDQAIATGAMLFARATRSLTTGAVLRRGRLFQQVGFQALTEKARSRTMAVAGAIQRAGLARSLALAARLTTSGALTATVGGTVARLRQTLASTVAGAVRRGGVLRQVTLAAHLAPPPVVQVLAVLQGTAERTLSFNARLVATVSRSVGLLAVLRQSRIASYVTLGALLERARSKTLAAQGALQRLARTTTTAVAARIVVQASQVVSAAAVVSRVRQLRTMGAAAAVQRTGLPRAMAVVAQLAPPPVMRVAAVLAATATQTVGGGARLVATVARDLAMQAVLLRAHLRERTTVAALLEKARSRSVGVTGAVAQSGLTRAVTGNAILVLVAAVQMTVVGTVQRLRRKLTLGLSGSLYAYRQTFAATAHLQAVRIARTRIMATLHRAGATRAIGIGARIIVVRTAEITVAARLVVRSAQALGASSVLQRTTMAATSATAVLSAIGRTAASAADAFLRARREAGVAVAATLLATRVRRALTLGAVLLRTRARAVSLRGALLRRDVTRTTEVGTLVQQAGRTRALDLTGQVAVRVPLGVSAGAILGRTRTAAVQATAVLRGAIGRVLLATAILKRRAISASATVTGQVAGQHRAEVSIAGLVQRPAVEQPVTLAARLTQRLTLPLEVGAVLRRVVAQGAAATAVLLLAGGKKLVRRLSMTGRLVPAGTIQSESLAIELASPEPSLAMSAGAAELTGPQLTVPDQPEEQLEVTVGGPERVA